MSESTEAVSQAAEETVEAEATESTETAEQASAETENTEAAESRVAPGPVPYSRFKEVNEERKDLKARLERIEARLAEKPKPEETKPAEVGHPPEGMQGADALKWYVENYSKAMLEREFGMPIDKVKAILGVTRELSTDHAERQWAALCQTHGVDPKNQEVRREAAELLQAGVPPEKAALVAATIVKGRAKKPNGEIREANAETGGLDSTQMTREDWAAWSKDEAVDAAKKGKKAPMLTVEQIFARSDKRGK